MTLAQKELLQGVLGSSAHMWLPLLQSTCLSRHFPCLVSGTFCVPTAIDLVSGNSNHKFLVSIWKKHIPVSQRTFNHCELSQYAQ